MLKQAAANDSAHGRLRPSSARGAARSAQAHVPSFGLAHFARGGRAQPVRNLGRRREFGPVPKPAWAFSGPDKSWPLMTIRRPSFDFGESKPQAGSPLKP